MRISVNPHKLLPAGEARILRAEELEISLDDPRLPVRTVTFQDGGRRRLVAIGPVEPGGPEENLWEVDLDFSG